MRPNGVSGRLLKRFQNYLIIENNAWFLMVSQLIILLSNLGVPQGSVFGPLLSLIYINDLERNIKSNVIVFADYTMLFSIVNDPVTSANELNHYLKVIKSVGFSMEYGVQP